jgi:hypothetical protein
MKVKGVYNEFKSFITPIDEKTPSGLASLCDSIAILFGRALVAQLKAVFMGKQSGEVRGEQTVNADIAFDTVSMANPMIGAVLKSFPALSKTLRRNPALLDFALAKLGSMGNKSNSPVQVSPESGDNHQVKFKM